MLEGVTVLELSSGIAAGYAGMLLKRAGATVLRVPLGQHDGTEFDASRQRYVAGLEAWLHAGKGLRRPTGPAGIRELAGGADVVIDDIAKQRAELIGDLIATPPPVPWVVTTPYGLARPGGSDLTASALSGAISAIGRPGHPPLTLPHHQAAVQAGAVAAAVAVAETRAQAPRLIEVPWTDVISSYAATNATLFTWEREGHRAAGSGGAYPYTILPCKDGLVCLAARTNGEWRRILVALGDPDWATDSRFQDVRRIATDHADEVDALLVETLRSFTREELLVRSIELGCTIAPVRTVGDLQGDPDLNDIGAVGRVSGTDVPRLSWFDGQLVPNSAGDSSPRPRFRPGTRPLEGLRVLDFGWVVSGPLVGQMLAALGAEVIKLENRVRTDSLRLRGAYVDGAIDWERVNRVPTFHALNRGKRSVAVNIKDRAGLAIVRRLVSEVDLVVENFSAGAMERMGLGDDVLAGLNPNLVHVSLSPTGLQGRLTALRGYAATTGSLAGLEGAVGYGPEDVTGMLTFGLADYGAGAHAAFAALAALHGRDRSSPFVRIDASQLEATLVAMGASFAAYQAGHAVVPGNSSPLACPHGIYEVADGFVAIAVHEPASWRALVDALDLTFAPELPLGDRAEMAAQIDRQIGDRLASMGRTTAVELLERAGIDVAPVLRMEERPLHSFHSQRGADQTVRYGDGGSTLVPAVPWLECGERPVFRRERAPDLGEDTDEVLRTVLGMEGSEITSLRERGVVG